MTDTQHNRYRVLIVALMLMLSLRLTGILAQGLRPTGITEHMGLFIDKLFGQGERRLIFGMSAAAALSPFMNNIAAAPLLFPALSGVARRSKVSSACLLMPLAYCSKRLSGRWKIARRKSYGDRC